MAYVQANFCASAQELEAFDRLRHVVEGLGVEVAEEDALLEALGDDGVPDEYLDPILGTLMKDPVRLPTR